MARKVPTLNDKQKKESTIGDSYANPPRVGYQTGMNADGQAVNTGQVQAQFGRDASAYQPQQQSQDGQRAVQDAQRSMQYNSQAQMQRGLDAQNAEKQMQDQYARSELFQQGTANQAKIYSDINSRAVDQMSLAAKIKEAEIRNKYLLMQALVK